eukprot:TRINITY_DN3442_c0_g1_i1.p1 TRINITY_DN3442_c0_g1~~TRINITY_DN3442_c0_g1_i1.p1  ORF type:complete len:425 (-),score=27.23 TRINITY_DN3442_c0_g1_i1:104-1333(-)
MLHTVSRVAVCDATAPHVLHGGVVFVAVLLGSFLADRSGYFSGEFVSKPAPESALLLYKFGRLRESHNDLHGAIIAYEYAMTLHMTESSLESTDGIEVLLRTVTAKHDFHQDATRELDAMTRMLRKHRKTAMGHRLLFACNGFEQSLLSAAPKIRATFGWRAEVDVLSRATDMLEMRGTLMTSSIGAALLTRIGLTYSSTGNHYGKSFESYLLATQIFDGGHIPVSNHYSVLLNNIALCLGELGDSEGQLQFLEMAVQIANKVGGTNTAVLGHMLYQQSRLLIETGEIQKARVFWARANEEFRTGAKNGLSPASGYRSLVTYQIGKQVHAKGDLAWALEAYKLTEKLLAESHPKGDHNISPLLGQSMRIANVQVRELSAGQQSRLAAKLNAKLTRSGEVGPILQAYAKW